MKNVVYRGSLTEEKLQELCNDLAVHKEGKYTIEKQADGNFIGTTYKFGKVITVREAAPEYCLQRLLTHSGNE